MKKRVGSFIDSFILSSLYPSSGFFIGLRDEQTLSIASLGQHLDQRLLRRTWRRRRETFLMPDSIEFRTLSEAFTTRFSNSGTQFDTADTK